jgi:hypothetical protein
MTPMPPMPIPSEPFEVAFQTRHVESTPRATPHIVVIHVSAETYRANQRVDHRAPPCKVAAGCPAEGKLAASSDFRP